MQVGGERDVMYYGCARERNEAAFRFRGSQRSLLDCEPVTPFFLSTRLPLPLFP